jgi:FkbM family methyltransferase
MIAPKKVLRLAVLRLLRATAFDVRIRHHWAPMHRISLNSSKHKGYWYHGKNRERNSMETIAKLLRPGQTVIDVGAHIGYISLWLRHLVGDTGQVVLFEPSEENRRYLDRNMAPFTNVLIETAALADYEGEADFFVEDLTGQNNSLVESYDVFEANSAEAGVAANVTRMRVPVTSLDAWCDRAGVRPNFIKIDVEGAEEALLLGATETIKTARPVLMVEITRRHSAVLALIEGLGYCLFDDRLVPAEARRSGIYNCFCIPAESVSRHGAIDLDRVMSSPPNAGAAPAESP